jgi:hypothetical protein
VEGWVVRNECEIKSEVAQQLVELLGLVLGPLSRVATNALRRSHSLSALQRCQLGHLLNDREEGFGQGNLTLTAETVACR